MTKYVWATGNRIAGDPQLCGSEMMRLQREHGKRLTPQDVVEWARDSKHALHRCFEWDNGRAAESYRQHQARQVIRSVRVIKEQPADGEEPVLQRVFVNVIEEDDQQNYVTVARMMAEPELFEQARQRCLRDLEAFEKRYREFTSLVEPITRAKEELSLLGLGEEVLA